MLATGKRRTGGKGSNRRLQSSFRGGTNRLSDRLSPDLSKGILWLWARRAVDCTQTCLELTGRSRRFTWKNSEVATVKAGQVSVWNGRPRDLGFLRPSPLEGECR